VLGQVKTLARTLTMVDTLSLK